MPGQLSTSWRQRHHPPGGPHLQEILHCWRRCERRGWQSLPTNHPTGGRTRPLRCRGLMMMTSAAAPPAVAVAIVGHCRIQEGGHQPLLPCRKVAGRRPCHPAGSEGPVGGWQARPGLHRRPLHQRPRGCGRRGCRLCQGNWRDQRGGALLQFAWLEAPREFRQFGDAHLRRAPGSGTPRQSPGHLGCPAAALQSGQEGDD